ncbi:bifunctional DNA primase/polymerase [Sphingomonas sp. CL5.1]|uniref:bifunctional DNA primase/polymerase n=1 Tax=Sphingomonas sp. CL5.1 TaxID=2653203 RepID=UPI001583F81C|nr:bifunctional DNA primase/polymerase [Sphingomonas sp. CL5.1]QKR99202.1 bifunctional DNA primase/polymerase [Sphingomonas sp. CL5.1]
MTDHNFLTADTLIRAGVMVFPCQEGGASAKAPYTRRGFKDATTDQLTADLWSLKYPGAIWGLPCARNGVLVLDADRHGKGDGVSNIMTLFERHQFDWYTVPVVATPNGGYHFYFSRPVAMGQTRATLCEAVDVRDNAFVIGPDCRMLNGRRYSLVEGTLHQFAEAIATHSLPEPPAWMMPMLVHPPAPKWAGTPQPVAVDDEALRNQVKGLILAVLRAEDGNRNKLLFWAACRLAEMVRGDLLDLEVAKMLLDEAGARIGLDPQETRRTTISGLRTILGGDRNAR